ncbi:MAG: hypothetical protein QTO32_00545 [Candidatus Organicella extenuata]|uniref:Uncharacterized protein n=1 Tax=Candidatus Organicella extenuata TaxID=2841811 RepID=A0AA51BKL5_9BACT|nr:MAG: hypothetical protein QTO32_00545 [Candidatus Organicella extenuata]
MSGLRGWLINTKGGAVSEGFFRNFLYLKRKESFLNIKKSLIVEKLLTFYKKKTYRFIFKNVLFFKNVREVTFCKSIRFFSKDGFKLLKKCFFLDKKYRAVNFKCLPSLPTIKIQ